MPKAAWTLAWSAASDTYAWSGEPGGEVLSLIPDSPAWFARLAELPSFAFHGKNGSYTARQEHRGRDERYWYAYLRLGQKVRKKYLGKTADLTLARLEQVARVLQAERTHVASPGSALPVPHEEGHAEPLPAFPAPLHQREQDAHPHSHPLPIQPTRLIGREQDIS